MNSQKVGEVTVAALVALALIGGVIGGSVLKVMNANAQTPTASIQTLSQQNIQPSGQFDPSKGGHTANGKTEEILTGDLAEKAKNAALSAVPGGTIERLETDIEGDVYEAHMVKADGSRVTVKFDANFNVTRIETGSGGQMKGQKGPRT